MPVPWDGTASRHSHVRAESPTRGRHLVATKAQPRGRLLWIERPLLALPSLENRPDAWTCAACHAFLGGPVRALQHRWSRSPTPSSASSTLDDDDDDDHSEEYRTVPCRRNCGFVYCSADCERDVWAAHHRYLCTGHCAPDHPLVQFKTLAVQTNEILLLVATWWVAQHLDVTRTRTLPDTTESVPVQSRTTTTTTTNPTASSRYLDFCMTPWWDVISASEQPGNFTNDAVTLRRLCDDAAGCLNAALAETPIPPLTALDVARRIGACEQNAMGIRQRHVLARDIFRDRVRRDCHDDIVQCLVQAGFIGNDSNSDDDTDDDHDDHDSVEKVHDTTGSHSSIPSDDGEWDYSVDEIATFLAGLFLDEDGAVRDQADQSLEERDTTGDDLDYIFPPLDGTAMYATTCKMNHSCDPNVIVLYKRTGWGALHPLVAYCVALRDIQAGEELTISYIDANVPWAERQEALENYGFVCECPKCQCEKAGETHHPSTETNKVDPDELFGTSDDDEDDEKDADEEYNQPSNGEVALQRRLERLDSAANHSTFGSIPLSMSALVSAFVIQTARSISLPDDTPLPNLLRQCVVALGDRDYCMCRIVGTELEDCLFSLLQTNSAWPNTNYREAYWCAVLAATVGLTHVCYFLHAMRVLDKGMVLGLSRKDDRLAEFFGYVETHAAEMASAPYPPALECRVPDYRLSELTALLHTKGLSKAIQYPVESLDCTVSNDHLVSLYTSRSKPFVVPGMASHYPAVSKWRDFCYFVEHHGHRIIPIELGSMMSTVGMKENMMTIRDFVQSYLVESAERQVWSLDASLDTSHVAYLAQHAVLDQIPTLQGDLGTPPTLCGADGPTHTYVWMGTGGTRTPLHFDSYDNLFVQLVGAKYVRLYPRDATPNLYVSTSGTYGLQGNMSDVDCEREDWAVHGKARDAEYTEVLLLPGDALFIPARTWHYVRALSTSISVSYWF
jgi:hypothetical protein